MGIKRPSSSFSSTPQWTYDVFLNFRGEDTRNGFTDHLYAALKQKGIFTFRDDEKLERGKSISPELLEAIEKSRFAIVILSSNYASSTWCLDELAKINGCMKETGMVILPIFYHVNPSDVRNQTGTFAQAFDKHNKENIEKVQRWRAALREVANLSGWHLQDGPESKIIQDIVGVLWHKLSYTYSEDIEDLVGIISRAEKLKSYLAIGSNDVRIIGVWGMGGIGKTTIARVVFDMVSSKFEGCCFLANIGKVSKNDGLLRLQKRIILEIFKERLSIQDVFHGVTMISSRLRHKRILLVLDDVNQLDQLNKLGKKRSWFGSGSRVIITTRDKHLLQILGVDEIYDPEGLENDEALHLLSLKAFKRVHPPSDYIKLSKDIVYYAKGLPLAIEILGSFLFGRSIDKWKSTLNKLKEFPNREILKVLKRSFDGLDEAEKEIFLHIACFFNHEIKNNVETILAYLHLYPDVGIEVLVEKSLIKVNDNGLWMHDLIQEMGRDIVYQECPKEPGKRSRLWSFQDIDNVLTNNTGTKAIQGIVLKLREPKKVYWNPKAFSKMRNLKLLIISGVQLMHGLKHLPSSLRVIDWRDYPSKLLTSSFPSKCVGNLKFVALKPIKAPEVPNLETSVLVNYINLRQIHPSIGIYKMLPILNLIYCKNFTSLPSKFEIECLVELNLTGCSKITEIPEFGRNMKRVRRLYIGYTAITTLPTSIEHLTDLVELCVNSCKNLVRLPSTIFNLKLVRKVCLQFCSKLDRLPENLGDAESLEELDLWETAIREVPSSIGLLKHLHRLILSDCKGLSSNKSRYELFSSLSLSPASSLTSLLLRDCNLKAISNDIGSLVSLEWLDLSGNDFVCLPESIIRLSKLKWMHLNNCRSLQSLPKLPLNVELVEAGDCISLEMLPDPLKQSDSLEPSLYLHNCSKLADNQSCIDRFISGIKKSLKLSPSLPLSVLKKEYNILIPGSEIPEWFSPQSTGNEVKIKLPSHLCKNVGIAICFVSCTYDFLDYSLIANGKEICIGYHESSAYVSSDHLWLVYATPQFFDEESNKLLWEDDVNGFSQIRIKIESDFDVKKWGFRLICKVKRSRDDYNGAGPSGEGSSNDIPNPKRIKWHTEARGKSDCEESSEYKVYDEELSDWDESNDSNPDA